MKHHTQLRVLKLSFVHQDHFHLLSLSLPQAFFSSMPQG